MPRGEFFRNRDMVYCIPIVYQSWWRRARGKIVRHQLCNTSCNSPTLEWSSKVNNSYMFYVKQCHLFGLWNVRTMETLAPGPWSDPPGRQAHLPGIAYWILSLHSVSAQRHLICLWIRACNHIFKFRALLSVVLVQSSSMAWMAVSVLRTCCLSLSQKGAPY